MLTPLVLLNKLPVLTKSTPRAAWFCLLVAALAGVFAACGGPVQRVDLQNPDPNDKTEAKAPEVLVVTLKGKLGTTELARCHRSIREAETNESVNLVVFRMESAGSQGENLTDLQTLYDRVQSTDIPTVAVLRGRITQGAAGLALCAKSAYCLAGAEWGEVQKPEGEIDVYFEDDPEAAQNRYLNDVKAMMSGRLDRRANKLRPDARKLALAMVDPRVQLVSATVREGGIERARILDRDELVELQKAGASIFAEQPMPRPLLVTAMEAEEFGLSNGTLESYGYLAEILNFNPDAVGELDENWAENMVAWLELLQPFLLVAGFLMLLVEVKTPGTGLPGLLGVVFLSLALFHSYLVGLAEVTEIIVFFLGLIAIAVEIFVLPGTVVFGVVGFLCLILALVLSRQSFVLPSNSLEQGILVTNLANLTLLFITVMVLGALMWRLLPKVPGFNRMFLQPPGPGGEPDSNSAASGLGLENDKLVDLVGRTAVAATTLRPTGAMEIDGERVNVVTEGEFVDAGASIRVLYVQGNRVVVGSEATEAVPQREGERGSVGLVVLLSIVGLTLIVAEVMFVSMGIIGIIAAGTLLSAVFVAFQVSTGFGVAMAIIEAVAAPLVFMWSFKILPHTPFGKKLILSGPPTDGSAAAGDASLGSLVGKTGVTLSALRPAGYARIDGQKVDVVTRGDMLPEGCEIVVLEASGNRVVVARAADAPTAPPEASPDSSAASSEPNP